jgi:hypothetical protein
MSFSQIASAYGVARATVRRLCKENGVPTYLIGTARVVGPAHWPRLRWLVERHVESRPARSA